MVAEPVVVSGVCRRCQAPLRTTAQGPRVRAAGWECRASVEAIDGKPLASGEIDLLATATSAITLVFDELIRPRIAFRREMRRLYSRYRHPLLAAANSLERQVNTIVRNSGSE